MKREFANPQAHWNWSVPAAHSQGVRCGNFIWISGQMDLDDASRARHPGDIAAQAKNAVSNVERVIGEFGCGLKHVVKLLCFYVNDGTRDETGVLEMIGAELPDGLRPAIKIGRAHV